MAYDEGLADRLRTIFAGRPEVVEQKMFGGVAYMVAGNMCCGVIGNTLMARVGPEAYREALTQPHAHPMDMTGRPMKGFVVVDPPGIATDADLLTWVARCEKFIETLPPK